MKTTQSKKKPNNSRAFFITIAAVVVVLITGVILVSQYSSGKAAYKIDYNTLPRLGDVNAPVKIIEVGDLKCPACKYWEESFLKLVKRDFIDNGKAQFYFVNFAFLGPDSKTAAIAGKALLSQNVDYFWQYYDLMYKAQQSETVTWATEDFITNLVSSNIHGVNMEKFKSDMKSKEMEDKYAEDKKIVDSFNITSTPAIIINGKQMQNPMNYNELINAVLDSSKAGNGK